MGSAGAVGAAGAAAIGGAIALAVGTALAGFLAGKYVSDKLDLGGGTRKQEASGNAAWIQGIQSRFMADRARAEEALAGAQSKLTAALSAGSAAWANLIDLQERLRGRLQTTLDTMRADGEAMLAKFRTPEQNERALNNKIFDLVKAEGAAYSGYSSTKSDYKANPSEQNKERLMGYQQQYLAALEQEHRLNIQLFDLEGQRAEKMRDQVHSIEDLTNADRTRLLGLKEQFKNAATPEQIGRTFESLTPEAQKLSKLALTPDQQKKLDEYMGGKFGRNAQTPTVNGFTPEESEADFADRANKVGSLSGQEVDQAHQSILKNTRQQLEVAAHVKVTSDDIKLVISADSTDKANDAIKALLDKHAAAMKRAIEDSLKDITPQMMSRMVKEAESQYWNSESGLTPGS